jgi:anion-transporting  ArsA/GET3 family ATPase
MSDLLSTLLPIDQALQDRRVLITCGTGGVGKTTLSAAIALRAALQGKKAVVITIDPAKRLSTSLGMNGKLGDEPTDLSPKIRSILKNPESFGSLHAIVPDSQKTFEAFFTELADNPISAQRILRNPIFQIFSKEFSGANEYMAMERLHALYEKGDYDCIILDTPPSRNTLAFLNAPRLLAQLFEEKLIRWLVLPANKLVSAGMRKALSILEKLTGAGFMTHLLDFASCLFELRVRFTANLDKITGLLESPDVGFIMVTTPSPDLAPEARHFIQTLKDHRLHFDGVALNRTLSHLNTTDPTDEAKRPRGLQLLKALQRTEKEVVSDLEALKIPICAKLPELSRDVHSLEDLLHVAMAFDHTFTAGFTPDTLPNAVKEAWFGAY